jgi:hypothetical protein
MAVTDEHQSHNIDENLLDRNNLDTCGLLCLANVNNSTALGLEVKIKSQLG